MAGLLSICWVTTSKLLYTFASLFPHLSNGGDDIFLNRGLLAQNLYWGEDGYIYMAESLHCSPETVTTLLTDYTPIQNKSLKKLYKVPSKTLNYI